MRVQAIGFTCIGIGVVTSNYFQATGRATVSIILGLLRQAMILIPLLFLLPRIYGFSGVWWSMPASDILAGVICASILYWEIRRLRRMISISSEIDP